MTDDLRRSIHESPHLWRLVAIVLVVVAAIGVARILRRAVAWLYWRRVDRERPDRVEQLRRTKRQQTIVTLLESVARYVVYGAALVAIVGIVSGGVPSALAGGALFVVVIGFGMQRLLVDVVAGMLLLIEGQYAVGDYIEIAQPQVGGIVESFSVRATTLRSLGGERTVVLNGSINAFTRIAHGYRRFETSVIVRGDARRAAARAEAALQRVRAIAGDRFLELPEAAEVHEIAGKRSIVRVRALVPPSLDALVRELLVSELARSFGDALDGEPTVTAVGPDDFERYARNVIITDQP